MRFILNSSPFTKEYSDCIIVTLGTPSNQIFTSVQNKNKNEVVKQISNSFSFKRRGAKTPLHPELTSPLPSRLFFPLSEQRLADFYVCFVFPLKVLPLLKKTVLQVLTDTFELNIEILMADTNAAASDRNCNHPE